MTEIRERRISHKELTRIVFRCERKDCGAELVIDMSVARQLDRFRAEPGHTGRSFTSPFCEEPFDPSLRAAIEGYRTFLYYMSLAKQEAVFGLAESAP